MNTRLLNVLNQPWALQPEKYREMRDLYITHLKGDKIDIAAIEARIGEPLQRREEGFDVIGRTAVIPVHGVIAQRANLFTQISGGISSQILARMIADLSDDPDIDSIVLDIDSPGGEVHGTQEVANTIREARDRKQIVAFSSSLMASAAYWIASATSRVVISGDTVFTGSIGVVVSHTDVSKRDDMMGVKVTEITSGRFKRIDSSHAPLSDEGRDMLQERADHVMTVFATSVAQNRGMDVDDLVQRAGDGRIFLGRQAIDAGLVDGVSTLEALIESLNDGSLFDGDGDDPTQARHDVTHEEPAMELSSLTLSDLREHRPDLVQAIESGVTVVAPEVDVDDLRAEGAIAERGRIRTVFDQAMPGHEALIEKLMFDGESNGGDAAMAILAAQREQRTARIEEVRNDAPAPIADGASEQEGAVSFEVLVQEYMAEHECGKGTAVREVSRANPQAHAAYLKRINTKDEAA